MQLRVDAAQKRKRNRILLTMFIPLIGLALFPYGWLAERWLLFGRLVEFIFGTELAHIVGHFALFAGLGAVVLLTFPRLRNRPFLYVALILFAGFLQEVLQLATFKERPFAANEILDIIVDLLGAVVIFKIVQKTDWGIYQHDPARTTLEK